jgi:enoyl-[acyl-carrier-protein] reductase (NADH)
MGMADSGILAGKKVLVTGVLTEASIAFATARLAQEQGATVVSASPSGCRRRPPSSSSTSPTPST